MPKFVIERNIPEIGKLTPQQLQAASFKSRTVLRELGPQIHWVHSYVSDDKMYCVYVSPDEETIRQHVEQSGFPASRISRIGSVIDATTAE